MVPYNVPASALDLLKRFLSGKPFIDVELPQVRHAGYPKEFQKGKGAEKWMNLPEYPAMPKEHNAGEKPHTYDYWANFPSWNTERLEGPNTAVLTAGPIKEKESFASTTATAFLAGMVVAAVITQFVNGRKKNRQGYQVIPEASLDEHE
jgi:hypothetical protein